MKTTASAGLPGRMESTARALVRQASCGDRPPPAMACMPAASTDGVPVQERIST
jgi:hypothetical protein